MSQRVHCYLWHSSNLADSCITQQRSSRWHPSNSLSREFGKVDFKDPQRHLDREGVF